LDLQRFQNWNTAFLKYISTCRTKEIVPLFSSSLGGTGLFIFCTKEIQENITEEESTLVEFGRSKSTIKGAICYRCNVRSSSSSLSLAFAGVHFTADQEKENVLARIQDYQTLISSNFSSGKNFLNGNDLSCIVGDVNFRINLPREEIAKHSKEGNYRTLLEYDQLNIAKQEGKAFQEYSEGEITFPPTYKYILGSEDFDLLEPPGKRSPAYTDRIFYSTPQAGISVSMHHYALGRLDESDHKPVSCYFTCTKDVQCRGSLVSFM